MRILTEPKVYLIARPQIVEEGMSEFLSDQKLDWPTPTEGVKDAERLVEVAGRCCFDDATEILTSEGWKLFRDLSCTEDVLTLNKVTNYCEWQRPKAYQQYDYDGPLKFAEGRDISLAVTPEHRQWGSYTAEGEKSFVTTDEIADHEFRIQKSCAGWTGSVPESIEFPEVSYRRLISRGSVSEREDIRVIPPR